jgi:hypothetical protein
MTSRVVDDVFTSCQDVTIAGGEKFPEAWGENGKLFFDKMLTFQKGMHIYEEMLVKYVDDGKYGPVNSSSTPCAEVCPCSACRSRCGVKRPSPLVPAQVLGMPALDFGVYSGMAITAGIFGVLLFVASQKRLRGFHEEAESVVYATAPHSASAEDTQSLIGPH